MATGFESYTVEIDDGGDWDGDTPVTGSGVKGLTVLMVTPVGECCLTPGDPSPIGRCPETGDLVYLDRPADRARDAAADLLASLRAILPYAESMVEDMAIDVREGGGGPEDKASQAAAEASIAAAKALLASLDGDAPDAADASEGAANG
jgi:hypothetical protein